MIAAIFLVPLVYFVNAFFIGRLIKRWKIDVNPFIATIVGFVALFDIVYVLGIWMYAGRANIWSYFVIFGIVQGLLVAAYIVNWRYIFLNWSVNWHKIIIFIVCFGLVILIGWLNFREYNSEFGKNWIWIIEHSQLDITKPMWFGTNENDVVSNFSGFNIMNMFWIDAFKIIEKNDGLTFCNWSWTIIAAGFLACLATWINGENRSIPRIIFSLLIILVFVVVTLAFIETYAIGDAWVFLLLFVYVLVMIKQTTNADLKLFLLTTISLGFLAASCTSFYVVVCVWIFSMYYGMRNRENSLTYFLFLSWSLLLTIFSFLSIFTYWLLSLINAIYLVFALICVLVFSRMGTPAWETKIATSVYRHSTKIIYSALGIFIALILIANFFIFQEVYHWDPSKIDYHNFLTFTYTYLWTFNIESIVNVAVFNAVMYAGFVAIVIFYLVIRNMKKHKLNPLFKKDSAIKLGVGSCIFFINPFVIHMLKISTTNFPLNTLDLNMLFVAPLFILLLKIVYNHKRVPITQWKYNWY